MSNSSTNSKREYLNRIKKNFLEELKKQKEEFKPTKELTTHSTIPIITSNNYPQVSTMQVTNNSIESSQFEQNDFVKKEYDHILKHKARSFVGTTNQVHKTNFNSKLNETLQDVYASKKAIESTHKFEDEIKVGKVLSSKVAGLLGNSTKLQSISVDDNISISKLIEKHRVGETKSKDAILELYYKGFNDNQIRSMLSLGSFGIDVNKVLVPTKWSISACDSVIEQDLYKKVIEYPISNDYEIFEHQDKENHFIIIFLPETFCSEVVETWRIKDEQGTRTTQTEFDKVSRTWHEGRGWALERDFVRNNNKLQTKEPQCAGGYYATKLVMFEHLYAKKRQSACISIRVIGEYEIPLGVIFVRECVREAIKKNPVLSTQNEFEFYEFMKKNYNLHNQFLHNSPVLKEIKQFKTLNKWV